MDKIINLLINNWTKGVDTYTHNGSTWLIFTEQRSWVIELTECKTLWYNYNFFKELFSLTSMDVVDNQHYITKWVEDNIIGGVKYTSVLTNVDFGELEEAIQNGVKRTVPESIDDSFAIEDTIQNGVKETQFNSYENKSWVEGVIKGGVKHTEYGDWLDGDERLDEIVENGVKETIECDWNIPKYVINEVISEGVKKTMEGNYTDPSTSLLHIKWETQIEDVIDNGNKVCGTYVGGHRQEEKTETVIEYGKQI